MIPFIDFGGTGPLLHFAHANGYPPECYRPLAQRLTAHYHVLAMEQRPLWKHSSPTKIEDWRPLTDDLLKFLSERKAKEIIAVGHSLGGIVSLRAALRQPERFRALILLDPVLFTPAMIVFWRLLRALRLDTRLLPNVQAALARRRTFKSRESIVRGYRRKTVFRYMSDSSLRAYATGITRCRKTGRQKKSEDARFELAYSPEWEARIYITGVWNDLDLWRGLPRLNIPLLVVRGAETNTFRASASRMVQRYQPRARAITFENATHLVPLERPDEVSQAIHTFIQEFT